MNLHLWNKKIALFFSFVLISYACFANGDLFQQARTFQRNGEYDRAIEAFESYLSQPAKHNEYSQQEIAEYSDALVQLMNTFQSKGAPETCVTTLRELYSTSEILQKECLRDYYSVLGYALSRTENMEEAENVTLKAFTIPLQHATPERYFRDYAYAAAVFYSNHRYQNEVINWCQEALQQAKLCKNTSGKQWVTALLGSIYKRNGHISQALALYLQSKNEAQERGDDLGVLNSLNALVDLFLYWDVPEYANLYASEAIEVEERMTKRNPMISAQTYINKGRALQQLGKVDSVVIYTEKANELCRALPYNSGMVDVDIIHGSYLTDKGGDSLHLGIQELLQAARQGTDTNRARAYHQLAQTYLKSKKYNLAEAMLDSMYSLLNQNDEPVVIHINYAPILDYYLKSKNHKKVEQYTRMMLHEQQILKDKRLNYNLVEAIAEAQTEQQRQELKIVQLEHTNQQLWFLVCVILLLVTTVTIATLLLRQRRLHKIEVAKSSERLSAMAKELNRTIDEKRLISQEMNEIISDRSKRQELESITPSILQQKGEAKFRQRFELLHPHFLPQLREQIPSITHREELLSMLIVLKQDNKSIADLLAIAPRSVLMLRHRFRQKIGLHSDKSLEQFIEEVLTAHNSAN